MKQQLFEVSAKNKMTGEVINIHVWAKNVDEATRQLCDPLFGAYGEYTWQGSGPVYENNEVVWRFIVEDHRSPLTSL